MQLPCDRVPLTALDIPALRAAILERRVAIRESRDQRMDDRCWVDDFPVWMMVTGLVTAPLVPFNYDEVMRICTQFYHCRRAEHPDPVPPDAITDPAHWDDDLDAKDQAQLLDELLRIQYAIVRHYEAHHRTDRPGTADDDRELYGVLPEKMPADLRLPPESHFLGEAKAPEGGCPAFWRSHDGCGPECNLHQWGPCPKK